MTSRTVSGSVKTTSLIAVGLIPCADSSTICARRQVTTEPELRRTIRSSRFPSSALISRSFTRAAMEASRSPTDRDSLFYDGGAGPPFNPANVAGRSTSRFIVRSRARSSARPAHVS